MGFIDPMVISNVAATSVLQFSIGPTLWGLTVGLLVTGGAAIALSGLHLRGARRLELPRLAHARLVAASVGRAR